MRAAPSITRLFAATFIAVALVGLVTQIAIWLSARDTQAAMVALAQGLDRVPENQPDEFGAIARGVNRMAATLAWREGLHEYLAQLLAALNAPPDEAGSGLTQALGVIAGATRATGIALYQPSYDTNEWASTAAQGLAPHPVSPATMRSIMGDTDQAIHFHGESA